MPWTGFMYNFDGTVKNCIRNAGELGNIQDTPIEQIMLGPTNSKTQELMLDSKPGPTCFTCYDLEKGKNSFDIISDRVFYIRELKHVPLTTYKQGNFNLSTVDIRWSNVCNFACMYCGPRFSSKWASEINLVQDVPSADQINNFKQYIFENAKNLKHVYLAGGEPLLMKENLELLALLDPDVNIRINTNLSKVDTKVFETVCKFKNVHWIVSVETIEEEYEYIRYGGKWNDFLDNLQIISNLNHKVSFNMIYFMLNYLSIFKCIDFLRKHGFHNNSFVVGSLLQPEYLNVRQLPEPMILQAKEVIQSNLNSDCTHLLEDGLKNILSYLDTKIERTISDSLARIKELDTRRGINSQVVFKDFYNELNKHYLVD